MARFAEVKSENVNAEDLGKEVSYENFNASTFVDVTGTSKGKGFQGVMKRHNFQGGPAAHGSKFHRTPGSVGQATYPGRIFKQKKMPGQMGNKTKTVQNLQVVELNEEQGYMLIKGSIPGAKNGFVRIAKAIKKA
jgi:large subunit ribosomal protein L3